MERRVVSIIVPVYKVEPYLCRCLDSIVGQTYRDLEIILVDDGSPDNCGAICDEYAARDKRLRVIHKENGGVASARNAGLDIATGDYIGWVDSDDWVEPDMFQTMLTAAETHKADIVICGRIESYPDHSISVGWRKTEVLDQKQAMAQMVEDDVVKSYLWDKLWQRRLFEGIRFSDLEVYEDMAVMVPLFSRAERVACVPDALYHYEHRETSLSTDPPLKNRMDFYAVIERRREELEKEFPALAQRLETTQILSAVGIWPACGGCTKEERQVYLPQLQEIAAFCRENYKETLKRSQLGLAGRSVLRLTSHATPWAFALANWISKLYERKHRRPL